MFPWERRPSARWAAATVTAVLGCGALVLGPALTGNGARVDSTGVLLSALAGLCYASYSLIGRRLITAGHPAGAVMGAMFGGATLLALALLAASGTHWLGTVRGAGVALHLAVFTTFVAYRLFGRGLRRTPAQAATTLTLAEAAVAAVLGVVALREQLPVASWCGLAVLALALAFLTVPAGRRGWPGTDRRGSP
jgi:drug/metabolite transporter, DME family